MLTNTRILQSNKLPKPLLLQRSMYPLYSCARIKVVLNVSHNLIELSESSLYHMLKRYSQSKLVCIYYGNNVNDDFFYIYI